LRTVDKLAGGEPVLLRPAVTRHHSQSTSKKEVMGFDLNTSFSAGKISSFSQADQD